MKRKTTTLIKDLELQIDYLIGYTPQGLHWKQEYGLREEMIKAFKGDDTIPQELKEKLFNIQNSLYRLRNKEINDQQYLKGYEVELTTEKRKIPITYMGRDVEYIEL